MISTRVIASFVSLLFVQFVIAQSSPVIKATVDKNRILLGEPVKLEVEAFIPAGSDNKFPAIDSIEHFEFLEEPGVASSDKDGGTKIIKTYTITSFDSGHWVIPAFFISPSVTTDTIPIDVVFSDFNPAQDYHPVKDILEVQVKEKKTPWWWYAIGGALIMVLLLWYITRKKSTIAAAPKPIFAINAYEEAMQQLQQLNNSKPVAKQYYSQLTDIFRLYIFRKKGILSLQKTTDDLVIQIKNLNLSKDQFDKLSQALRLSDFVKFAKYVPVNEDDENTFNEIKNTITTIEKSETKIPL
jgi:hypothetical protein